MLHLVCCVPMKRLHPVENRREKQMSKNVKWGITSTRSKPQCLPGEQVFCEGNNEDVLENEQRGANDEL